MSDMRFLFDGPAEAPMTLVLAHGAGAPMDSPFMTAFAEGLGERGLRSRVHFRDGCDRFR